MPLEKKEGETKTSNIDYVESAYLKESNFNLESNNGKSVNV